MKGKHQGANRRKEMGLVIHTSDAVYHRMIFLEFIKKGCCEDGSEQNDH